MNIAYLINQYPKVSHSFVRREIVGIEAQDFTVRRYSIRSCAAELVDPADLEELRQTHFLLEEGAIQLISSFLWVGLTRLPQWLQALQLTLQLGIRHSERGIIRHLAYLVEACRLLQLFQQDRIDHVHAHFGTNPATVAMLCHMLGGPPFSFTVHGPEEFDHPYELGLPEKIAQAKFVVAISSFGRGQLYRWCDYQYWPKIQVVRCGVDASFVQAEDVAIPTQAKFVCVGRLCEQKGQILLIEAVKQLVDEGYVLHLTLVGDGELRSQIETLIHTYQLTEVITITGWASGAEVQQQLLQSRAMVLPSFAEGLPVVIMEALALGRPVVSTYIAGIPELIEPGVNGWLVVSGSIPALVEAMKAAISAAPQALQAMGQAGAQRVQARHDASKEAARLAELFQCVDIAACSPLEFQPAVEPLEPTSV